MVRRLALLAGAIAAVTSLAAQLPARTGVPRLWTDEALAGWALPIAGVKATPKYYTEAEYYAAPVDEVRTYPVYIKSREPEGYRDWMRKQGPQPLIEPAKLTSEADWIAAGREVFDGLHLAEFRTADPRAFRWADDPDLMAREGVTVAADGTIPGVRWLIDHDRQLKITLAECSGCHTRVLPDGSIVRGAQRNLQWGSLPRFSFDALDEIRRREGRTRPPNENAYSSYGVPWLKDDINATLKTMTAEQVGHVDGEPFLGTFVRFNASPWFTTRIADLIGVKDRRYLDATATHRNRGPEDIARYGILVTVAEDGAIGPHTFLSAADRALRYRYSDEAMLALGKYIYSLQPPPNPNRPNDVTARGEQVFAACPLRQMPHAAALHQQPAGAGRRVHAVRASVVAAGLGRDARAGWPRSGARAEDAEGNRLLQGAVAQRPMVSRTVRALGLDCVARRVVRSGAVARRLPPERLEPAGYTRAAHPGPPVRVELGGRRQARAHRVSEDALKWWTLRA